ncbi:hypothetical protein B9Z31_09295 [Limnohabitans sp. G3-2]|nr:hypothetical protein B9Z31_09295 [Limnohabitans sp. G3-2]
MPRVITLSRQVSAEFQQPIGFFGPSTLLRTQELSNHPELIRGLGLITFNCIRAPGRIRGTNWPKPA